MSDKTTEQSIWIRCPYCTEKTKTKVYRDSLLLRFPRFCPRCKREYRVNIIHGKIYPAQ